jgi:hypothetical protein
MNLTREHIIFTLGIDLPLNESLDNLNEDFKKRIIFEQMIYENFIDSIKKYASEKWDKVVTTITDWKDAAVILGKVITDPKTISNFSDQLWRNFKNNILKKLIDLLKKLKLDNFIPQVMGVVDKITNLTGWQKFLAATSIASITQYIITKLPNLSAEGLLKWIKSYFSDNIISTIISKLTDFSTYVGWLQPIIKGTEILFYVLKPTIDKFKFAFDKLNLKPNLTPQTENNMKKELLKKIIKEEIAKMKQEATLPANQPAVKQTSATKQYAAATKTATAVGTKAGQLKSINDLPGAFETWFNSLGLKGQSGITQATILSKVRDTLNKMGVK